VCRVILFVEAANSFLHVIAGIRLGSTAGSGKMCGRLWLRPTGAYPSFDEFSSCAHGNHCLDPNRSQNSLVAGPPNYGCGLVVR
jgi:hypothetical protein